MVYKAVQQDFTPPLLSDTEIYFSHLQLYFLSFFSNKKAVPQTPVFNIKYDSPWASPKEERGTSALTSAELQGSANPYLCCRGLVILILPPPESQKEHQACRLVEV